MTITLTEKEAVAFLMLKHMISSAPTPPHEFFEWVAARLINYGDSPNVDFVQALRRYSDDFDKITTTLNR
jgi:hypothetical protein